MTSLFRAVREIQRQRAEIERLQNELQREKDDRMAEEELGVDSSRSKVDYLKEPEPGAPWSKIR